jgi:hypothetical protein
MKTYRGSRSKTPHILNFSNRNRLAIKLTSMQLYLGTFECEVVWDHEQVLAFYED